MLGLMALSFLAALLFIYIFMPDLWLSIMSIDESLDSHESGLALVASRMSFPFYLIPLPKSYKILGNPFRETGPPANMAKLILLRHKVGHSSLSSFSHFMPLIQIQTTNRKRRCASPSRQAPRTYPISSRSNPKSSWMRFGKSFGGKQHH